MKTLSFLDKVQDYYGFYSDTQLEVISEWLENVSEKGKELLYKKVISEYRYKKPPLLSDLREFYASLEMLELPAPVNIYGGEQKSATLIAEEFDRIKKIIQTGAGVTSREVGFVATWADIEFLVRMFKELGWQDSRIDSYLGKAIDRIRSGEKINPRTYAEKFIHEERRKSRESEGERIINSAFTENRAYI